MFLTLPDIIIALRQLYSTDIVTVKGRTRPGQQRMATNVKTETNVEYKERYLHRRYPFWLATVSARRRVGLQG